MYTTHYRTMTSRPRKPQHQPTDLVMGADRVWGAAAYADRINGGELYREPKFRVTEDGGITDEVVHQPNKNIMWGAIMDTSRMTPADVEMGLQARDWIRKNLTFKSLQGSLSEFDRALSGVTEMDSFRLNTDRYEIALVTSQIRAYREGTRMERVMEDVIRTPVAAVGEKVQLNVEVVKVVYSNKYNVYFVTAKTDGHQMVFFSYRERLPVHEFLTVRGTVKAHRVDATQLNRVRVVK
jgi:hypothetical protein